MSFDRNLVKRLSTEPYVINCRNYKISLEWRIILTHWPKYSKLPAFISALMEKILLRNHTSFQRRKIDIFTELNGICCISVEER